MTTVHLRLDNHGSHRSASSVKLAAKLNIGLFWPPRQCPELTPVDHLWGGLKNTLAADRQFAAIDDQVRHDWRGFTGSQPSRRPQESRPANRPA